MTISILAWLACTGAEQTDESCTESCLSDLQLEVSERVPMAVRASWTVGQAGQCHALYREIGGDWWSTPVEGCSPGERHTAVLRGLHADTDIEVEVVLTIQGVEHPRHAATVRTNLLPEGVPVFTVDVPWSGDGDGGYIQGSFSEDLAGIFVLDRDGRYVYLWMNESDQRRDIFNARLASDLSAFWVLLNQKRVAKDWGLLVRRDWFGDVRRKVEVPYAHHDLLPLEDGSVLVVEGDPDDPEQEVPIWGDRVVRIDLDDTQTVLWSSWDDLEPPERIASKNGWFDHGVDWIHGNSLAWNPARETVLMGSPQLDALFEIDGLDGGLVRIYGGATDDGWKVDGEPFQHPHGTHWTDDDTLLMLSTVWLSKETTAIEYRLDESREALVPGWTYSDPERYARAGGNATEYGDMGHRLISYGSGLVLQEVDPDGQVTWQVSVEGTSVIFQVWPVADLWGGAANQR